MKKANARKFAFRRGLDDKRTRSSSSGAGFEDDEEEQPVAESGSGKKAEDAAAGAVVAAESLSDEDVDGSSSSSALTKRELRLLEEMSKPDNWAEVPEGDRMSADIAEILKTLQQKDDSKSGKKSE